jgi:hypothetical protein
MVERNDPAGVSVLRRAGRQDTALMRAWDGVFADVCKAQSDLGLPAGRPGLKILLSGKKSL